MISRTIAQAIARDAIQIEQNNAKILRDNLLKARAKLLKNPSAWQYEQYGKFLDEVLGEYEAAALEDFPVEETLEHGTKEGRLFTGADLNIDKSAKFWGWSPVLPLNAIAIEESKFADLITKATADFKKEALRTVQQGLAMGASTQDLMDDLLGVGVSGAKGRDGKFRKAVTRAETIARTVSNDLINKGAMITYGQIDRISPELNLQKIWQTLSDNRTSDRCISLSGQKRELNEPFQAGDGWTGQNPPAHPNCRSRVTSRAKNRNYTQAIDDRFAQEDIAAIATPQKEPAPLSEPLPKPPKKTKAATPKTEKPPTIKEPQKGAHPTAPKQKKVEEKAKIAKAKPVATNPALSKSVMDFDIASEKQVFASMKATKPPFGDPDYNVKNFVEYNNAKMLVEGNKPGAFSSKKEAMDAIKYGGIAPHESTLKELKFSKKEQAEISKHLKTNQKALEKAMEQVKEAEAILDKKSVPDPSKWKATMSREEADEYFGEDNFYGQQSFWHGNSKRVTESIRVGGGQPERNKRGAYGRGVYAGASKGIGITYGDPNAHDGAELLEMRIYSKNPYVVESGAMADLMDDMETKGYGNDIRVLMKSKGYDSIFIKDTGYVVAFDKEQIVVVDHTKLEKDMASEKTFREAENAKISAFQEAMKKHGSPKTDVIGEYISFQEENEEEDDFFF